MDKLLKQLFLCTAACLFIGCDQVSAQWAIGELNLSHQYDVDAEVALRCKPTTSNDSLSLLVALDIRQGKPQLTDYTFDIFLVGSISDKLKAPISKSLIDSTFLYSAKKTHAFKFRLPFKPSNWVVIRVISKFSGFSFYFEFPLSTSHNPSFSLMRNKKKVTAPYISPDDYVISQSVTAFYYSHVFSPALPPMVTKAPLPEKEMTIDSVFNINANTSINLNNQGLYYIQYDTATNVGTGLLLEHKYYPELATLPHLIEPLVYITTKEEKENLDQITEKKAFDKFWLDLTSSQERAVKIIKAYYDRVEEANALFTSFKEGWKTDRGMIYIVFGLPDEVIKSDNGEKWVYLTNANLSKVTFKFIKSHNIFSSSHYVLIRDKKYDNIWFNAIDLWRKSRF